MEAKIGDLTITELEAVIRRVVVDMLQKNNDLTIDQLHWTPQQALAIRGQLAAFTEDWDDPSMDIYDEV